MRREEAIALMTNTVIVMNTKLGITNGVPQDQIDQTLAQMKPELDKVNELIFDAMYDSGIINLHS
jgi:hypothetical protein